MNRRFHPYTWGGGGGRHGARQGCFHGVGARRVTVRLGGVQLAVHPGLLLVLLAAFAARLGSEVAIFAAALAGHELAHALAAGAFGLRIRRIELLPFGGVAEVDGLELADPGVEAVVALAGPLHNLLCLAAGFLLQAHGLLSPGRGQFFLEANAALALGNLLPALPLDGGRVVRAALALRQGHGPATAWVSRAGLWVAGLLAAAAVVLAVRGVLAPSLLVFSYFTYARARPAQGVARMRLWRELARRGAGLGDAAVLPLQPLAADPAVPLRRVVERFAPRSYHLLWLVAPGGAARGPWDEAAILATLRRKGSDVPAAELPDGAAGRTHGL